MHTKQSILKQKIVKIEFWVMSSYFTIITSILTKKNYDNKILTDEDKRKYDFKQFEIIDNGDQGLKSTKKNTETKKTIMVWNK